ncbi:MAG: hypothetical protein AB8B78_10795 [Polaribacter sp.]
MKLALFVKLTTLNSNNEYNIVYLVLPNASIFAKLNQSLIRANSNKL